MKFPGIRVAVLRGGPSSHYEHSLKTGEHVLSGLRDLSDYHPIDIFISKDGEWHRDGLVEEPHRALRHVEVVWNALHGPYGKDGQVQRLLEEMKIPFTGSGAVASVLATNKDMAKRLYRNHSLHTPAHETLSAEDFDEGKIVEIFRNYMHPVVIRSASTKGSVGARLVHSFHDLKEAIKETFKHSPRVLVEEGVSGDEVSCVVLEGVKGEKIFAFEPISNRDKTKKLTKPITKTIEEMAKKAHEVLGLRHFSSSHFVVSPKGRVYIMETEASPVFHKDSHVNRVLEKAGWRHNDFIDHVIKLALNK